MKLEFLIAEMKDAKFNNRLPMASEYPRPSAEIKLSVTLELLGFGDFQDYVIDGKTFDENKVLMDIFDGKIKIKALKNLKP